LLPHNANRRRSVPLVADFLDTFGEGAPSSIGVTP